MLRQRLGWVMLVAGIAMAVYWVTIAMIPRVMMHVAMGRIEQNAAVNMMGHAPLSTAERRVIVRPSPDLAYSTCLFDLGEGPVIVSVAPIDAPYWSLSVFDRDTNVAFIRNDRDVAGGGVEIALARPGQAVPDGVEVVRVASDRGLALLRILVTEPEAFGAVDQARRGAHCGPMR